MQALLTSGERRKGKILQEEPEQGFDYAAHYYLTSAKPRTGALSVSESPGLAHIVSFSRLPQSLPPPRHPWLVCEPKMTGRGWGDNSIILRPKVAWALLVVLVSLRSQPQSALLAQVAPRRARKARSDCDLVYLCFESGFRPVTHKRFILVEPRPAASTSFPVETLLGSAGPVSKLGIWNDRPQTNH